MHTEHERDRVVRLFASEREVLELGLDQIEIAAHLEVQKHAGQALFVGALPAGDQTATEEIAPERRDFAVARPILAARAELGLAAGVIVAPEERAGLRVVAAVHE